MCCASLYVTVTRVCGGCVCKEKEVKYNMTIEILTIYCNFEIYFEVEV